MKTAAWAWTEQGVLFDHRDGEGCRERLWVCPVPTDAATRSERSLRVEILCWFATIAALNSGLQVIRSSFQRDTVLAAMRRTDDATRVLLYTSVREPLVHERYFAVRAILRPTAIGLRLSRDTDWSALSAMVQDGPCEPVDGTLGRAHGQ